MADIPHGGRIVPIVDTPQSSTNSTTPSSSSFTSSSSSTSSDDASVDLPPLQKKHHKHRSARPSKPTRKTRTMTVEPECLELSCLKELDLYALPTEGDGNCLYYALSDQVFGDFGHAEDIRVRLADHIGANKEYFMNFIPAVGGERRAPRRAAASAAKYASHRSSASASPAPPSSKDKDRSFDTKVAESRKAGVWGGAEEIQAFCQSFKMDVNVYTEYGVQNFRDVHAPESEERDVVHVAFHDFNHYSSVRHLNGPRTGLPCIPKISKEAEKEATTVANAVVDVATPWKISAIQEGLGGKYDRAVIVDMLEQCRGNIDSAFGNLISEGGPAIEAPAPRAIMKTRLQPSSRSSSPFSTGSKRSADDTDEEDPRPANRRLRTRDQKRRILPDVTVGIAFRDDRNDLVSLRLRVSPDATVQHSPLEPVPQTDSDSVSRTSPVALDQTQNVEGGEAVEAGETAPPESTSDEQKPRRSKRISRSRNSPAI
ncbi:hypothetical protein P168DRAFT_297581 [Aspergillus campestris IBT 28561]|uniref:OTU domain-containing protein n=1 Tax=Aspergillus campestris (strain IBT 28561) TaxID=1392248 RepID=A0A2I1D1E0_ASPC2|nr:uncharacterized protein P168DRAFT_297581 [Aspergillus campestris IBT 28561]PKY03685.1 hypothetical protein P168DRAFT_297581 [Aspergillus campestris IBT 28561]